jgi:hypothetical protein
MRGGAYAALLALVLLALHAGAADSAAGAEGAPTAAVDQGTVSSAALGCTASAGGGASSSVARVELAQTLPTSALDVECRFALVLETSAWSVEGAGGSGRGGGIITIPRLQTPNTSRGVEFWQNVSLVMESVGGVTGVLTGVTRGAVVAPVVTDGNVTVTVVQCELPPVGGEAPNARTAGRDWPEIAQNILQNTCQPSCLAVSGIP